MCGCDGQKGLGLRFIGGVMTPLTCLSQNAYNALFTTTAPSCCFFLFVPKNSPPQSSVFLASVCGLCVDSLPHPLPCQPEEWPAERQRVREQRERGKGKGNKRNVQSTIIQEPFSVLLYETTVGSH